jgi:acetyl esterase/lipase
LRRSWPAILVFLLGIAVLPDADAGRLMDALRARRERQQQPAPDGAAQAPDDLESGEGGSTGKVVLPPGTRLERDVAYGSDAAQRLDVYIPAQARNAPVILMVHGGAWMLGDKSRAPVVANKIAYWLPKGYVVAAMNYRMARPPDALEQADDVARAIAYVQGHAAAWGADPDRLVLVGHSSGGHLVALLAADPGIALRDGAKPWLGTVVLDSAALNVVAIMEGRHARFYDRVFGADRARWARNSPLQRLSGRPRPLLLVCSTRRDDSCPAARAFADKAAAAGGRAEVVPVDLNHGEVNAELGRAPTYTAAVQSFLRSLGLP